MKKGGLDTIVAYIVVMIPLLYVLIYMVATIYHYSVQMYMNQVVKEAAVMASTYGGITEAHENYITGKLKDVLGVDSEGNTKCEIIYYKRTFSETDGTVGKISDPIPDVKDVGAKKADIIGIQVISKDPSILDAVTAFGMLSGSNSVYDEGRLKYSSYREEIIRNERPYDPD